VSVVRLSRLRLVILVTLLLTVPALLAEKPTWAKKATAFENKCRDRKDGAKCVPLRIPSRDGRSSVEVLYRQPYKDDDAIQDVKVAYLKVASPDGRIRETTLPFGFQSVDLLWSPDSKSFFVNGGKGGGFWGFWVYVYQISDPKLDPIDVTRDAQRDMVKTYPPCRATGLDEVQCKDLENNPDSNMSGIDWLPDSTTIIVMAEIPCSGGHGGIMCQVMGYEIEVPTGKIRTRMSASELKARWQKSMAWKFVAPFPPNYKLQK